MPISNTFDPYTGGAIGGGGGSTPTPTPPASSDILAQWDFSIMPNQDLLAGGDGAKTMEPTGGSTAGGQDWTLWNSANNTGANCSFAVDGGKLKLQSDGTTSIFGTGYWSALHTPVLGIPISGLSSTLSSDPSLENHRYVVEIEWEPGLGQSPANNNIPLYQYLHIGIVNDLSTYTAGNGKPTAGMLTGNRKTNVNYPADVADTYIHNNGTTRYHGFTWFTLGSATDPAWADFYNTLPDKVQISYEAPLTRINVENSNNFKRMLNSFYTDSNRHYSIDPTGLQSVGATNDIWLIIAVQRSTGSSLPGEHFAINKITLRETGL